MHLELWHIIVLAVIQGVTEFLPISSDGHLAIAAALLAGGKTEMLDVPDVIVVLHGGTLLSILVFYWQRIIELLLAHRRTIWLIMAATVPAVGVGLPVEMFAKEWLASVPLTGICLIVTGLVLLLAGYTVPGARHYRAMSFWKPLQLGLARRLQYCQDCPAAAARLRLDCEWD